MDLGHDTHARTLYLCLAAIRIVRTFEKASIRFNLQLFSLAWPDVRRSTSTNHTRKTLRDSCQNPFRIPESSMLIKAPFKYLLGLACQSQPLHTLWRQCRLTSMFMFTIRYYLGVLD